MSTLKQSSHQYKKGDLVVFQNITWESEGNSGFHTDHLHEVIKVHRHHNYLEIKEAKCRHCNRKRLGSDGTDIRFATPEEINACSRLPKTIAFSSYNPKAQVVFLTGSTEIHFISRYTNNNSLIVTNAAGAERLTEIFEIREATEREMRLGHREVD